LRGLTRDAAQCQRNHGSDQKIEFLNPHIYLRLTAVNLAPERPFHATTHVLMGQSATRLDHITLGTVPNITSADVAVATIDLRDGFDVGPFLVI
jgi:hypothetical protein